jgi:hypothetical protein
MMELEDTEKNKLEDLNDYIDKIKNPSTTGGFSINRKNNLKNRSP